MPNQKPNNQNTSRVQASQLERGRLIQLRATQTHTPPPDSPSDFSSPTARLQQGLIAKQNEQTEQLDDFGPMAKGGSKKTPLPNMSKAKQALGQIRWRGIFWSKALIGCWFFLPLLPVAFHKLSTDGQISSAIKTIAKALRSPTSKDPSIIAAKLALNSFPQTKLALQLARFVDVLFMVEWVVILVLITLVGLLYLAGITLIALSLFCIMSPVECGVQGFKTIFGM